MRSGFLALICFFVISITTAYGAFEDMELGARPLSMGSAYVAAASGASAIFWNPAGLSRTDQRELTMSYMELYHLVSYSAVGYTQHIKSLPTGFGLVSSSDLDGVYRETVIILSAAKEIYRNLSAGSNFKYLSSAANVGYFRIGNGRGVSLDLGCQYHIKENLASLGIAFQNLMGYVSYDRKAMQEIPGQKYWQRPDFSYKFGVSINLGQLSNRISNSDLTAELSEGDFHAGAEYVFRDMLSIRAGVRTGNALMSSITMGFGLKLSDITVDYAYIGSQIGAQTSQFSVSISW